MNAQGIAHATIVGHSMGSYVAQQVALAAPKRVARLVLIGSSTTPRTIIDFNELNRQMQALRDPVPTEFIREFQESTVHAPVPAEFMDRVIAESARVPARVWREAFSGMAATDAPKGLAQWRIPTLILWGDHEPLMPRSEQDALMALFGTAVLHAYPEAGHAPHWEWPADVARDIAVFLRTEPAPLR
jgi:pimeloyl-ACP methyl ester carboxylesterase